MAVFFEVLTCRAVIGWRCSGIGRWGNGRDGRSLSVGFLEVSSRLRNEGGLRLIQPAELLS